jgi:protein-disulfide isomerase
VIASQAAQAVWLIAPDRYLDFHSALMGARGELNENRVLDIAAKVGLDRDKMKAGMDDPRVAETLANNLALGRALGVNGTPAFVIGGQLVPGAIDLDTMKELVAEVRQKA